MSYPVTNPGTLPIYATMEGRAYSIAPGETVEVESHRDALNLTQYGARLDVAHLRAAEAAEDERVALERYTEGRRPAVAPRDVAAAVGVEDVPGLRGAALDAALTANGLPTSGKADEKRARLLEALTQGPAATAESGAAIVVAQADDPTAEMTDEEVTEALAALDVEVPDDADEQARRGLLTQKLAD